MHISRLIGSLASLYNGARPADIIPERGSFYLESKNGDWTRTTSPTNPGSWHENSIPDEYTNQKRRGTFSDCEGRSCHLKRTGGTSPGCKLRRDNLLSLHNQFLVSLSRRHRNFLPTKLMLCSDPEWHVLLDWQPCEFRILPRTRNEAGCWWLGSHPLLSVRPNAPLASDDRARPQQPSSYSQYV